MRETRELLDPMEAAPAQLEQLDTGGPPAVIFIEGLEETHPWGDGTGAHMGNQRVEAGHVNFASFPQEAAGD